MMVTLLLICGGCANSCSLSDNAPRSLCPSAGLMGLLEKRRFRDFMAAASDFDEANPSTYKGESHTHTCLLHVHLYKYV